MEIKLNKEIDSLMKSQTEMKSWGSQQKAPADQMK